MADKSRQKFNSFNEFAQSGVKKKPATNDADVITVRVRATRVGYYGLELRQEGAEFEVRVKKDSKLPSWMEPVDGTSIESTPIPETQETAHLRGETSGDPDSVI